MTEFYSKVQFEIGLIDTPDGFCAKEVQLKITSRNGEELAWSTPVDLADDIAFEIMKKAREGKVKHFTSVSKENV